MIILLIALLIFGLTSIMSMAGIGAAFILVPTFILLGIDIHTAMAMALLLNTVSNCVSSYTYIRMKLVEWPLAIPVLIVAMILSPLGVYVSQQLNRNTLLMAFSIFLVGASIWMLFYNPKPKEGGSFSRRFQTVCGSFIGAIAGFIGGLLGIGGGMIIMPSFIAIGLEPRRASATSSFTIIFASFAGFLAHANIEKMDFTLIACASIASIAGARVGSWLVSHKVKGAHIKKLVGVIMISTACKMLWEAFCR